ncbi:hypothetical protein RFI_14953, partial [Reticulomyxa filosa]
MKTFFVGKLLSRSGEDGAHLPAEGVNTCLHFFLFLFDYTNLYPLVVNESKKSNKAKKVHLTNTPSSSVSPKQSPKQGIKLWTKESESGTSNSLEVRLARGLSGSSNRKDARDVHSSPSMKMDSTNKNHHMSSSSSNASIGSVSMSVSGGSVTSSSNNPTKKSKQ